MRGSVRACCRAAVALAVLLAAGRVQGQTAGPAGGADEQRARVVERMWERLARALDAASAEREPLVPPEPVDVRWQARRVSSIDLGAPLLALRAADLDGDGRAELLALTSRELLIVAHPGHRKLAIQARAALPAEPAAIRPRDPVGSLVIADTDGDGRAELWARSSEQERGAVFAYRGAALVEIGRFEGFALCAGAFAELAPGRNYFARLVPAAEVGVEPTAPDPAGDAPADDDAADAGEAPEDPGAGRAVATNPPGPAPPLAGALPALVAGDFYAARCRRDLVDAAGRPLAVAAVLGRDRTLRLWARSQCPRGAADCRSEDAPDGAPDDPARTRSLADIGITFDIADIDRDGHPEIAVTAATPPGDGDRVTVLTWNGKDLDRVFGRAFTGGVVAVTAADIDADGIDDVVAAVRLWGSHRVDLWTFN